MSRLYFSYAFSPVEPSPWALVSILNKAGVSAEDFRIGHFTNKMLVAGLIRSWVENTYKRQPLKLMVERARLRRAMVEYGRRRVPAIQLLLKAVNVPNGALVTMCQDAAKFAELYTDKDGKAASCKKWGFSYDESAQYEDELSRLKQVKCPACGVGSIFNDDLEDEPLKNVSGFDHITGPYCRCEQCDTVVRPTIEDADELPYGWRDDSSDEWADYKECLGQIVTELGEHLNKEAGLREPDFLFITYNNSDWRGRTGYKTIAFDGEELAEALTVSGGFSVTDGWLHLMPGGYGYIDCGMSHHDASGSVRVEPIWISDLCSYRPEPEEHQLLDFAAMTGTAVLAAQAADILLCGYASEFRYSEEDKFKSISVQDLQEGVEELQVNFSRSFQMDHGYGLAVYMLLDEVIKLTKQGIVPTTEFCLKLKSVLVHLAEEV